MPDILFEKNGLTWRDSVGLVLLNAQNEGAVGRRADACAKSPCHPYWQYPQGGREVGETVEDSAYRELWEELGLEARDVHLLGTLPHRTEYVLPEKYRTRDFDAQMHTWVVLRYLHERLPDPTKAPHKEFAEVAWRGHWWLTEHAEDFRVPVFKQVAAELDIQLLVLATA